MSGYLRVLENIKNTAIACGRNPEEIKLVVVSKTRSIEEIMNIYNLGHRLFAENRVQEGQIKIPAMPKDIEWHLIGHLQTNKAKQAVSLFGMIQSVDSIKVAEALSKYAAENNKKLNCLIEVKISDEETKQGAGENEIYDIAKRISELPCLAACGLMGMAPFTSDETAVRNSFRKLKKLFDKISMENIPDVKMQWLSMGMSSDYKIAIEEGTNMLRIGTAVFEN